MISLEEVRSTIVAAFKAVHDVNYPNTLVNYPNFVVVDLEHQVEPFITLELDIPDTEQAALGGREILVGGTLDVIFYYRDGTGLSGAYLYTDMLNEYLGQEAFDSVQYQAVKTFNIVSFPGWKGKMNRIKFDIVSTPSC